MKRPFHSDQITIRGEKLLEGRLFRAWFDASIKDGSITVGYRIVSHRDKVIKELGFKTSNKKVKDINSAESLALNLLLKYITLSLSNENVLITGDSKAVINQILDDSYNNRIYKLNENIDIFFRNKNISIQWRDRSFNTRTDKIVKFAHKERVSVQGEADLSHENAR